MKAYFAHPTALVESREIGTDTRIWAFSHVMDGAIVGKQCNIGDHCFIESGVSIGDNVTIKNTTAIWNGITIDANVFIGPHVVFTNDLRPRSPRLPLVAEKYRRTTHWKRHTHIHEGVSIGANATILCNLAIAEYAMIGAGTLVTQDVPAYSLFYGVPGYFRGHVCRCGEALIFRDARAQCRNCGCRYQQDRQQVLCTHIPEGAAWKAV